MSVSAASIASSAAVRFRLSLRREGAAVFGPGCKPSFAALPLFAGTLAQRPFMENVEEVKVSIPNRQILQNIFGVSDEYLRVIRKTLGVRVVQDGGDLLIRSAEPGAALKGSRLIEGLWKAASYRGEMLSMDDVLRAISEVEQDRPVSQIPPIEVYGGKRIFPRTAGQADYVSVLRRKEIVFCCGPAGTGKTYLAVARAVEAFRTEGIKKLVLVRPAVEAGESLGFLPGDLRDKVNPYLRPLFDALADMIQPEMLSRYRDDDRIEVIPLAYMRGRTLNNAYIILDEAQNTTVAQMKMFLTRMGEGSRIAVCGDATQVDLPSHKKSGLADALVRLRGISGIGQIALTGDDIVRHDLVQKIVSAYEEPGESSQAVR